MDKICRDQLVLKSLTNEFFNEISQSVEKNNWSEHLREVVSNFVRLEYDDRRGCLEA